MNEDLNQLGDALERSVAVDLDRRSARKPRRRRRALVGVAAMLVVLPGAAYAAGSLISTAEVADSMPAGTLALMGTEPECEVVREGVEFECTLTNPPQSTFPSQNQPTLADQLKANTPTDTVVVMSRDARCGEIRRRARIKGQPKAKILCATSGSSGAVEAENESWMNAAQPTVDAEKRVNGGCRSQDAEGMTWRCYIGEEAVKQKIIGRGFLGEYAPHPSVG